jgi:hypothetical protein
MLSVPCPFHAPFLFSVFHLLHTASFYMLESLSIVAPISSLFCVFILSVHLLHPPCTMPLYALQCAMVLFLGLFIATPLFLCFARSSINTLSLFCMFTSCRVSFWVPQFFGGYSAFIITGCYSLASLGVETLRLLYHSRAHPLCCSYRLQRSSICQSPLSTVFIPLEDALRLFIFSGDHPEVSLSPLIETISDF